MDNKQLEIKAVKYGSPDYDETVKLRDEVLRKPLGLQFTKEQLATEESQIHLALFKDSRVVACLVLVPSSGEAIKMRQVAVAPSLQRLGLGAFLLRYAEKYAHRLGFCLVYCHARDIAVPFYLKYAYSVVGDPFTEVGIKHFRLEKQLC